MILMKINCYIVYQSTARHMDSNIQHSTRNSNNAISVTRHYRYSATLSQDRQHDSEDSAIKKAWRLSVDGRIQCNKEDVEAVSG